MATLTVNVGSFRKSSVGGTTAYGTLQNFQIPAGVTITGCSVSFTTHAATGTTADRAFSLNGVRAHSGWANTGISLTSSLLSPGNNTFRVTLRSTGGATESCFWDISNITLSITYNEGGGGGGGSTGGGGPVVISPSAIDAGAGSVTVTCPAEGGIWHMINWSFGSQSGQWSHPWEAGGTGTINIPLSWASEMPSATQGTLAIRVRRSTTPSMPYSYATDQTTNVTIRVPPSVVPSIGSFGASRIANNTPAGVSGYVQNVSGVSLAMSSVSGAYGSTISAYKITGAGYTFNASSGSISVLPISGNIAFTAEVTDSRGRKATKVVGIDVLAYKSVSASNVSAYRSDASKNPADEGVFATLRAKMVIGSLDGQNTGEVKGRVYEKGTTPPAWTTMANDTLVLFGGELSIEKVYTADILVADLITSYQYSIDIPTATVIMGIAPDGDGVSFGMYPEAGKVKSAWPIIAPGMPPNPNLLHNWDFRNPVNQRGAGYVAGANVYGLDRWKVPAWGGAYQVDAGSVSNHGGFAQRIENVQQLLGKVATLSICVSGAIQSRTFTIPSAVGGSVALPWIYATASSYFAITVTATSSYLDVEFNVNEIIYGIEMVKLELGPVSTLHLDPPMDHAVELPKCLRFYRELPQGIKLAGIIFSTTAYLQYQLDPPMRIAPTIGTLPSINVYWVNSSGNVSVTSSGSTVHRLEMSMPVLVDSGPVTGEATGKITLSSDL